MRNDRELAALVSLLQAKGVRWSEVSEQVENAGSAIEVLRHHLEPVELSLFDAGDPDGGAPDLGPAGSDGRIEAALEAPLNQIRDWRGEGINLTSVLDQSYPLNLRSVYNRPPILFTRGELIAQDERSVAVVGTRGASPDAITEAKEAARVLVSADYTVVSGLAAGIDRAAHTGAIEAGGRTVAVIGTGLNHSYPKQNAQLQRKLGEEFAVVS